MKKRTSMTPLRIGGIEIKNRYCAGSVTGRWLLYEQSGAYSPNGVEFEVSHARGGFGLIVTGSNYGDQTVDPFNPMADKPSPLYMPKVSGSSFRMVSERVHQYGSKIFLQVAFGPGRMRNGKAPSVLPTRSDPTKYTTELTKDEIERLIDGAVRLAKYGKDNGFDGVEIHAHFGYLLDQFEMECTNHRTDEYGGDLDGRLTVIRKIIQGIHNVCGRNFPVAIRMGLKTYMKSFTEASIDGKNEFGRDIEETIKVAKKLEEYGVDMFDFNSGTYESHYYCTNPYYMHKGYNIALASRVKKEVNVPVFCVGLMDDVEMCEKALANGDIDGVTICRAAMVDTQYARKVAENRVEDIRPCIQCCSCEHWNLKTGVPLCSANPAAMREWSYGVNKTHQPKKVIVVGGGIAGLVAAHTAARAGHAVAIYDQNNELGGHMLEIACQSFKNGVKQLNKWYCRELEKLGVEVNTGKKLCVDSIKALGADVVILATGSEYAPSELPGADSDKTVTAIDVITGKAQVSGKVIVIGGGCVGGEIAYDLVKSGKDVTLLEKNKSVAADKQLTDDVHQMLNELLAYHGAKVLTETTAVAIQESGVATDKGELLTADTIIIATGTRRAESLYEGVIGNGIEVYEIGDATGARNTIQTASLQAYEIARSL